MSLDPNDNLIVQRGSSLYKVNSNDLMSKLQDNDLLIVSRNGTNYKIKGSEFKSGMDQSEAPVIGSVVLTENNAGGPRFSGETFNTAFSMTNSGNPEALLGIQAKFNAQLSDRLETDPITSVTTLSPEWVGVSFDSAPRWNSIHYGNGRWVAVGYSSYTSAVAYSDDAINWTQVSTPEISAKGVSYGNGVWMVVGDFGSSRCIVSDDNGVTWTSKNIASNGYMSTVYSPFQDRWMVGGQGNVFAYSSNNGETWNVSSQSNFVNQDCCYDIKTRRYIFVGNSGRCFYSTSGSSVNPASNTPVNSTLYGVAANEDGMIVAVGGNSTYPVVFSQDGGSSWSTATTGAAVADWRSVAWGDGKFVAVGHGVAMYSYDGIQWQPYSNNIQSFAQCESVAYGGGQYAACSINLDATPFYRSFTAGTNDARLVTFSGNKDLDLLEYQDSVTQFDGGGSGIVGSVDVANKQISVTSLKGSLIVGQTLLGPLRPIITSNVTNISVNTADTSNGKWFYRDNNGLNSAGTNSKFAFNGSQILVLGAQRSGGAIKKSNDGLMWSLGSSDPYESRCGAWSASQNKWVVTGAVDYPGTHTLAGHGIKSSTDNGVTWSRAADNIPNGGSFDRCAYSPDLDLFVTSRSGEWWTSPDGINWTKSSVTKNMTEYTWGGGYFWGARQNTGVFKSTDGVNYDLVLGYTGAREISYINDTVITYSNNDLAFSTDNGNTWTTTLIPNGYWRSLAYGNGVYLLGNHTQNPGDDRFYIFSFNLKDWFTVPKADSYTGYQKVQDLIYYNGEFISLYLNNKIHYSTNGYGSTTTLTLSDNTFLHALNPGDPISQSNGARACVISVDIAGKKLTVAGVEGTFVTGQETIGPGSGTSVQRTIYGALDDNLNMINVLSSAPSFRECTTSSDIKVVDVLPLGETPDEFFLEGTQLTTVIQAKNLATPDVTKNSNTITPT